MPSSKSMGSIAAKDNLPALFLTKFLNFCPVVRSLPSSCLAFFVKAQNKAIFPAIALIGFSFFEEFCLNLEKLWFKPCPIS